MIRAAAGCGTVQRLARNPAHVSQLLGERQFRIFDEPFLYEGQELIISARAGVARFPNDDKRRIGTQPGALVGRAVALLFG